MWHYHSLTSLQSPGYTAFHLESFILFAEKIQFKSCNRLSFQRKKSCLCPDGRKGFTLTLHLPVDALWEINIEHKEEWFVLKKSLSVISTLMIHCLVSWREDCKIVIVMYICSLIIAILLSNILKSLSIDRNAQSKMNAGPISLNVNILWWKKPRQNQPTNRQDR